MALRGGSVKDDTGGWAVFTEQGASASQMTAAKVLDIVSQLPGMSGTANNAVSAYTQVKMSGYGMRNSLGQAPSKPLSETLG